MNSWKEYEDKKRKNAITSFILALLFNLIILGLFSALIQFFYNAIASVTNLPIINNYWIFFGGYIIITIFFQRKG